MTDLVTSTQSPTVKRRWRDMGDGSHAPVVALAADPSIDIGDVQIKPPADLVLMTAAAATQAGVAINAGTYNWFAYGVWNGATAQLQFSPNAGTTWINIDGAALTADGAFTNISFAAGQARVLIATPGGSTALTSSLLGVP